jgi:hypothetical protein
MDFDMKYPDPRMETANISEATISGPPNDSFDNSKPPQIRVSAQLAARMPTVFVNWWAGL